MTHRWSFRWGASAVTLGLALIVAACSGDTVLGPPDGPSCTVGTIAPGDSVHGVVSSASCQAFDYDDYVVTYVASWTLAMKKDQGYVVRMYHDSIPAGDLLNGYLQAYARGPHGEATMVTSQWSSFGIQNGRGGYNREMFLVGDRDRDVSIRVSAVTAGDTGAYSLVVLPCPVLAVNDTTTHAGIDLSAGCVAQSISTDDPLKVSFVTFPSDSDTATVSAHRTGGTGSFLSYLIGPTPDINCWNSDCVSDNTGFGTDADLAVRTNWPGRVAGMFAVRKDSTATISVAAGFTPPATAAGRTR